MARSSGKSKSTPDDKQKRKGLKDSSVRREEDGTSGRKKSGPSRRPRYPKRSEPDGPPPTYTSRSDIEEDITSTESEDSDSDVEDSVTGGLSTSKKAPVRSSRVSLRKIQMNQHSSSPEGRHDASKIVSIEGVSKKVNNVRVKKVIQAKKLIVPTVIRFVEESKTNSLFLEFETKSQAVKFMVEFQGKFLSSSTNMKYIDLENKEANNKKKSLGSITSDSKEKVKLKKKSVGNTVSDLKENLIFIYFGLRKSKKMYDLELLLFQKGKESCENFGHLPPSSQPQAVFDFIENKSGSHSKPTVIFLCSKSCEMFINFLCKRSNKPAVPEDIFLKWLDLNSTIRMMLDPNDWKAVSYEADRLDVLWKQILSGRPSNDLTKTQQMKEILLNIKSSTQDILANFGRKWSVAPGNLLMTVLNVGLVNTTDNEGHAVVGSIAISSPNKSGKKGEIMIPITPVSLEGDICHKSAEKLGLVYISSEDRWVYSGQMNEVKKGKPCVPASDGVVALMDGLEKLVNDGEFQGIVLSTIFNDLSLCYLLSLVKKYKLAPRFRKLVFGICNLETIWKEKKGSNLTLTDLQPFHNSKSSLTDDARSESLARAGLNAILDIYGDTPSLTQNSFPLTDPQTNAMLEASVEKLGLLEFSETVFETVLEKPNVSLEADQLGLVTLSIRPGLVHHAGSQYDLQPLHIEHKGKLEINAEYQTSSIPKGELRLTVKNVSEHRLKFSAGSTFGFVRMVPDLIMASLDDELDYSFPSEKSQKVKSIENEKYSWGARRSDSDDDSVVGLLSSSDDEKEPEPKLKEKNKRKSTKVKVEEISDEPVVKPALEEKKTKDKKTPSVKSKVKEKSAGQTSLLTFPSFESTDSNSSISSGKTRVTSGGQGGTDFISTLEDYRKKLQEHCSPQSEVGEEVSDMSQAEEDSELNKLIEIAAKSPEMLSFGNKDFIKELNELNHPITTDSWEDLSPSLEGIDLASGFDIGDISENPLSALEAAAESLEEDGTLKEVSEITSMSTNKSDRSVEVAVNFNKESSSYDVSYEVREDLEKTGTVNLRTEKLEASKPRIPIKVFKRCDPDPISSTSPLVAQLLAVQSRLIEDVGGDIEDQFPGLLGQEEFSPLCETLVRYLGLTMDQELDFEVTDFGDKLICELQGFMLDSFADMLEIIKEIYSKNPEASLDEWKESFCQRFESMNGINELVCDNFDLKAIQILVLHFLDDLHHPGPANVQGKDLIGFPAYELHDDDEELKSEEIETKHSFITEVEKVTEPVENSHDEKISDDKSLSDHLADEADDLPSDMEIYESFVSKSNMKNECESARSTYPQMQETKEKINPPIVNKFENNVDPQSVSPECEEIASKIAIVDIDAEENQSDSTKHVNLESNSVPPVTSLELDPIELKSKSPDNITMVSKLNLPEMSLGKKLAEDAKADSDINESEDTSPKNVLNEKPCKSSIVIVTQTGSPENVEEIKENKESCQNVKPTKSPINVLIVPEEKEQVVIPKQLESPECDSADAFILDPDKNFADIYLGVKDEYVEGKCKVMALRGEDPFFATFGLESLIIKGKEAPINGSLEEQLDGNGEDDDLILIYISELLPLSDVTFSSCNLAIPLSSWTDMVNFFDGFVLFHEPEEKCCVAFLKGEELCTAVVPKERVKKFDTVVDMKCLEPGLEVKLMVKQDSGADKSNFRASLCIPNPERKFYEMLDITNWSRKTKNHLTDDDTLADIIESFKSQVTIRIVTEKQRSFILVKASNKKTSCQTVKMILDTKVTFEKLPGMKPRLNPCLEIFMEFLPDSLNTTKSILDDLSLIEHYTGTSVKLLDGEVKIEGHDESLIKLAVDMLKHNISIQAVTSSQDLPKETQNKHQSPILKQSNLNARESCVQLDVTDKDEDSKVTSTTESVPEIFDIDIDIEETNDTGPVSTPITNPSSPISNPLEAEEQSQTEEEEALRGIFFSSQKTPEEVLQLQNYLVDPENPLKDPEMVEMKIGKDILIEPGINRNFTIFLKQKLNGPYNNHIHPDFQWSRSSIQMVSEIIKGTCVRLDLKNISRTVVNISGDQNILLLEKRVENTKSKLKKSNSFERKPKSSTNSSSSSRSVSPTIIYEPMKSSKGMISESPVKRKSSDEQMNVKKIKTGSGPKLVYNIRLEKSLSINPKSVVFVDAVVEDADNRIIDQVHEIRRHPGFKNSAIFVPDKQKKKINPNGKLKMSLRNRIDVKQDLSKGKLVGQVILMDTNDMKNTHLEECSSSSSVSTPPKNLSKKRVRNDSEPEVGPDEKRLNQEFHSVADNLMAWQIGSVERAKLKNQGLLLPEDVQELEKISTTAKSHAKNVKDDAEMKPDKGFILKLLQDSISKNVAKSHKTLPPLVKKHQRQSSTPTETSSSSSDVNKLIQSETGSPNQSSSGIQNVNLACNHYPLKKAVCPEALATGGNCKSQNCSPNLQHKFPQKFLKYMQQEFCLRYLNTKICEKAFPPYICPHNQHVYDVGPVVKYYRNFYQKTIRQCSNCMLKSEKASRMKAMEAEKTKQRVLASTASKTTIVSKSPSKAVNVSSRTDFLRMKAEEIKKSRSKTSEKPLGIHGEGDMRENTSKGIIKNIEKEKTQSIEENPIEQDCDPELFDKVHLVSEKLPQNQVKAEKNNDSADPTKPLNTLPLSGKIEKSSIETSCSSENKKLGNDKISSNFGKELINPSTGGHSVKKNVGDEPSKEAGQKGDEFDKRVNLEATSKSEERKKQVSIDSTGKREVKKLENTNLSTKLDVSDERKGVLQHKIVPVSQTEGVGISVKSIPLVQEKIENREDLLEKEVETNSVVQKGGESIVEFKQSKKLGESKVEVKPDMKENQDKLKDPEPTSPSEKVQSTVVGRLEVKKDTSDKIRLIPLANDRTEISEKNKLVMQEVKSISQTDDIDEDNAKSVSLRAEVLTNREDADTKFTKTDLSKETVQDGGTHMASFLEPSVDKKKSDVADTVTKSMTINKESNKEDVSNILEKELDVNSVNKQGLEEECIAEVPFMEKCPHTYFRKKLCRYRDQNKCPKKGCSDIHVLHPNLKIVYCKDYLRNPVNCSSDKKCEVAHLNHDQLQEAYDLSIKTQVLNCNRCLFSCKLFNRVKLSYKQARMCVQDFVSTCPKIDGKLVRCNNVHYDEIVHLGLKKNTCPDNSTEKSVVLQKYKEFDEEFRRNLKSAKGMCNICLTELSSMQQNFETSTKKTKDISENENSSATVKNVVPQSDNEPSNDLNVGEKNRDPVEDERDLESESKKIKLDKAVPNQDVISEKEETSCLPADDITIVSKTVEELGEVTPDINPDLNKDETLHEKEANSIYTQKEILKENASDLGVDKCNKSVGSVEHETKVSCLKVPNALNVEQTTPNSTEQQPKPLGIKQSKIDGLSNTEPTDQDKSGDTGKMFSFDNQPHIIPDQEKQNDTDNLKPTMEITTKHQDHLPSTNKYSCSDKNKTDSDEQMDINKVSTTLNKLSDEEIRSGLQNEELTTEGTEKHCDIQPSENHSTINVLSTVNSGDFVRINAKTCDSQNLEIGEEQLSVYQQSRSETGTLNDKPTTNPTVQDLAGNQSSNIDGPNIKNVPDTEKTCTKSVISKTFMEEKSNKKVEFPNKPQSIEKTTNQATSEVRKEEDEQTAAVTSLNSMEVSYPEKTKEPMCPELNNEDVQDAKTQKLHDPSCNSAEATRVTKQIDTNNVESTTTNINNAPIQLVTPGTNPTTPKVSSKTEEVRETEKQTSTTSSSPSSKQKFPSTSQGIEQIPMKSPESTKSPSLQLPQPDPKAITSSSQASSILSPQVKRKNCPYPPMALTGKCPKGNKCEFYHDTKKIPCREFRSMGRCRFGNGCKFGHYRYVSTKKK